VIDLLLLVPVLAASAAAGLLLLRLAGALPRPPHEHLLAGVVTGLGLTSMLSLGSAAAGILSPWPFATAAVAALVAGGPALVAAGRAVRWPRTGAAWALVAVCAVVFLAEAPTWFAPPVGGDQTKYHLAYPRLYAQAGGLVATPWTFWGQQQWLQNFLYTMAYAVRGENLARLMNAVSGVLAAVALATLVRRHFGRSLGVVAGALYFTLPISWSQMVRSGADTSVVIYAALAVSAWLDWAKGQRDADLRRAGILCGLAGGAKVMGLLVPALVGIGILVVMLRRRIAPVRFVTRAVVFGALAIVMLSPWYVRNVVETGDPLYPFGVKVFGGTHWSVEAGDYLDLYYSQYRAKEAAQREGEPYAGWEVVKFPWDLTMHPESFEDGKRQGQDVSPFVFAFLPSLLLLRRRRWAAVSVAAIGIAYGAIIAVGAWAHPRYVLPGVALALAAATPAARALCGRRVFAAVVALTIAGNLVLITRMFRPMWPDQVRVALGRMAPDAFLGKFADRWVFWHQANDQVPATGRVVVLEKIPHPYYIDRPFALLSYLEQGLVDYRQVQTVPALDAAIRGLDATHVAVEEDGLQAAADPFEAQTTALWRAYVAQLGPPVLRAGGYALYTVPRTEAPRG
jgi:4-amino-4-deoxy-L-arabinose transferase-like glycosyltransferase